MDPLFKISHVARSKIIRAIFIGVQETIVSIGSLPKCIVPFRKWHQARLIAMRERGRARAPNEERGSDVIRSQNERGGGGRETRRGENHRGPEVG